MYNNRNEFLTCLLSFRCEFDFVSHMAPSSLPWCVFNVSVAYHLIVAAHSFWTFPFSHQRSMIDLSNALNRRRNHGRDCCCIRHGIWCCIKVTLFWQWQNIGNCRCCCSFNAPIHSYLSFWVFSPLFYSNF